MHSQFTETVAKICLCTGIPMENILVHNEKYKYGKAKMSVSHEVISFLYKKTMATNVFHRVHVIYLFIHL